MDAPPQQTPVTEPRISRYRSVRRAQATSSPTQDFQSPQEQEDDTGHARSRYRRPHVTTNIPPQSPITGFPAGQDAGDRQRSFSPQAEEDRRRRYEESAARRRDTDSPRRRNGPREGVAGAAVNGSGQRHSAPASKEDLRNRPVKQRTNSQSPRKQRNGPSARSQHPQYTTSPVNDARAGESCFGLFKRKKSDDQVVTREKSTGPVQDDRPIPPQPAFIAQGGGGIVPGTDAPKSAINAGDRCVLIECNKSTVLLPVELATTASDLLMTAASRLSENIEPRTFLISEFFGKVGIQRPLRRYEHVRDVLNSWDDDRAHSLLITPAPASSHDPALLHASNAPRTKPAETAFVLYLSQKVGKWDRRHVFIKQDGQMLAKKKSTDKDQDATNICHLSDFDIYTPTPQQAARKIRPPKRLCFAIKSQQKTSMFMSTHDYVHFFCTNDAATGTLFYNAVQGWRSWYLIHMLGEGQRKREETMARPTTGTNFNNVRQPATEPTSPHAQQDVPHPLGSPTQFDERPMSSHAQQVYNLPIIRKPSTRNREYPPSSIPRKQQLADNEPLVKLIDRRTSIDHDKRDSGTFASAGLLGRTYSQRQRTQQERDAQDHRPFTAGPSLLNSTDVNRASGPTRTSSTRQPTRMLNTAVNTSGGGGDIKRSTSTRERGRGSIDISRSTSVRREPPKPLIDLTPVYKAPPQHVRKGKAFVPDEIGPGGLIDNATSPEDPLNLPPATDWRGQNAQQRGGASSGQGQTNGLLSPTLSSTGDGAAFAGDRKASRSDSPSRSRSRSTGRGPTRFQNTQAYAALHGTNPPPTALATESPTSPLNVLDGTGAGDGKESAFVPGGLLAYAAGAQGAKDTGRGVMSGNLARGPMIDVREESLYADGSLLRRAERKDSKK